MVLSRQLNGQSHRPFRSLFFCFVLSIHQLATIRWRFLAHLRPWPESFLQNDSLFIADVVFFQPELVQAHFVIRTGHEQQYEPLDALRSFCFFFYWILPSFTGFPGIGTSSKPVLASDSLANDFGVAV